METYHCNKCNKDKSIEDFPKSSKTCCRQCFKEYNQSYIKSLTPEQKEYYKENRKIQYLETYKPKAVKESKAPKPTRKKVIPKTISKHILKTVADKAREVLNNRKNPKVAIDREWYIHNSLWQLDYRQFLYFHSISSFDDRDWILNQYLPQDAVS